VLRGLTTVTLLADDVQAAADWYADLLGEKAYFQRPVEGPPAYVEFRVGDYQHELGIMDARYSAQPRPERPGGVLTYWAVDDVQATYERLLALGATAYDPPTERGPGFVTASVVDPWGNVLGVMANQHYFDVLAAR
jgi:predicted enzyme related to lactoylglutathione lyase